MGIVGRAITIHTECPTKKQPWINLQIRKKIKAKRLRATSCAIAMSNNSVESNRENIPIKFSSTVYFMTERLMKEVMILNWNSNFNFLKFHLITFSLLLSLSHSLFLSFSLSLSFTLSFSIFLYLSISLSLSFTCSLSLSFSITLSFFLIVSFYLPISFIFTFFLPIVLYISTFSFFTFSLFNSLSLSFPVYIFFYLLIYLLPLFHSLFFFL